MVNDQEPRYRLVDADGNVVGSLFAESDGTLKLQEGTSGNDKELSFSTEGALEVEQLGKNRHVAANYPGTDADARLTNAISAADDFDTIFLEPAIDYQTNRTITTELRIIGAQSTRNRPLDATWTFDSRVTLIDVGAGSGEVIFNSFNSSKYRGRGGTVTINASSCAVIGASDVSVTFTSGAGDGVADSLYSGSSVTDNDGGNTVGDVT